MQDPTQCYCCEPVCCAAPINKLKGKVTMLFITHQISRGLQEDEAFSFDSKQQAIRMEVVGDQKNEL